MLNTREKKAGIIKDLQERMKSSNLTVFLNFHGLKFKDMQTLRRQLKKDNIQCRVAKKTLIKLALQNLKINTENINLEGEVGLGLSRSEEIRALPKILFSFKKEQPNIKILGGIFENQYIDGNKVEEISKLPPKTILYANLIGQLASPLRGLVETIKSPLGGLVNIIHQVSQRGEKIQI